MRKNRTPIQPIFDVGTRPVTHQWSWTVSYKVASSGYATYCHVTASAGTEDDPLVGTAACFVELGDDLREVIECLAIESMLASCEPTLDGTPPHRRVVFTSNL